jgi:hypothetical protein
MQILVEREEEEVVLEREIPAARAYRWVGAWSPREKQMSMTSRGRFGVRSDRRGR